MDTLDKILDGIREAAPAMNPNAATLPVREAENFPITAGQLRALCQKYPSHPLAQHFLNAAGTFPADKKLVVERPDLVAMVENKDVDFVLKSETRKIAGASQKVNVLRKVLVPRGQAKNPTPTGMSETISIATEPSIPGEDD